MIDDIVNVTITRDTPVVSQIGFGVQNIMGINKAFTERIKFYSSITEVGGDFATTDKEYLSALSALSQNPSSPQIAISRRATSDNSVVTVSSVVLNSNYSIVIDGETFTFASGGSPTNVTIATGLVSLINGSGTLNVTATDNLDGTFDLDPDVATTDYVVKIESKLSIAFVTSTTPSDDLNAIIAESDDWYGLTYVERTEADVKLIATSIEALKKIFITSSSDADIVDTTDASDTTTISAIFKAQGLDRTLTFYHSKAGTEFADSAYLGSLLPLSIGSYDGAYIQLSGITPDKLTSTQRKNALDKNSNVYETRAGVNVTQLGNVASGVDIGSIIIFTDFLESDMQTRVFNSLVNNPKIPYTDAGIAVIQGQVEASLQNGVDIGGLSDNPAPTVTVPLVADVPSADKANNILRNVDFTGVYAGSIKKVEINGNISF